MGIAPYKYFTFDGASSRSYDVYLTGEGVFNAPERAVEMIEVPGRNGNFALDQGKFNNISVTYKAGIVDASESNFADKMSAVRNWLCSKVGYVRLSDDYNPNEYRMAVFASGVELDHADLKTGEFEITFDCKPQRWLTSGETATAVANNGTLSNPTLFDSEPLLAVKGYGTIDFNGYEIEITNQVIGDVVIANAPNSRVMWQGGRQYGSASKTWTRTLPLAVMNILNNGDTITVKGIQYHYQFIISGTLTSSARTDSNAKFHSAYKQIANNVVDITTSVDNLTFSNGTSSSYSNTTTTTLVYNGSNLTATVGEQVSYDGDRTLSFTQTFSCSNNNIGCSGSHIEGEVDGYSTTSTLGDPTYIDCDVGECYMIDSNDDIISLNGVIDLGSDLPKLASGTNTFTYDNTVTELKVTPRWWKV